MSQGRPSLDDDAKTAMQLLRLMKREEPEHRRLQALIRVATVRLCALHSAAEAAAYLHDFADRLMAPRPEHRDGVPRRQPAERTS